MRLGGAVAILLLCLCSARAGDWKRDVVEQAGLAVKYTTLKIDRDGNAHVAYSIDDGNRYPLRYAYWDHTVNRWFAMTVDQNVGISSLALDSKQRPHIAYTDFAGGRLRYARWDGQTWKTEVLPVSSRNANYYNSIAFTADDRPVISFYEYEGPRNTEFRIRLRVVMWTGKYWELRTVDGDPGSGKFNAMVSDARGWLHLAYANVSAGTGGMRYAWWDGQTWNLEILEGERENNGHGVGWSCNVAVDKDGTPHLTYMDEVERIVKYAVRKNGKWRIEALARTGGVAYPDRNSIAVDEDGTPYVGYFDGVNGTLNILHATGERWQAETIEADGAGYTSSMQIDRGVLWVSYTNANSGGLSVARRTLGTPKGEGAATARERVKEQR